MNQIYLRALDTSDIERTYNWHNDKLLYENLGNQFRFVSKYSEQKWIEEKANFLLNEINLAICLNETNQHIGNIYVRNIDWVSKNAELSGILIGEKEFRSKGYGSKALDLMIFHCFIDIGIRKLYAYILEKNVPSIKTFKKCGFNKEGCLIKHVFKNGNFENLLIYGLCVDVS